MRKPKKASPGWGIATFSATARLALRLDRDKLESGGGVIAGVETESAKSGNCPYASVAEGASAAANPEGS